MKVNGVQNTTDIFYVLIKLIQVYNNTNLKKLLQIFKCFSIFILQNFHD